MRCLWFLLQKERVVTTRTGNVDFITSHKKANVPIYIAYMDYERKIGGFHSILEPTGDVKADILKIKSILKDYKGKFPENGIR